MVILMSKYVRVTNKHSSLKTPVSRTIDNTPCQSTDPEIFFPDPMDTEKIQVAKRVCANCDPTTKGECLSFALTNSIRYGIWGGLTETERESIRRKVSRNKNG
jgi:WhiB family redox-sensing transcriptional regulator